jgi:hypothetical protein
MNKKMKIKLSLSQVNATIILFLLLAISACESRNGKIGNTQTPQKPMLTEVNKAVLTNKSIKILWEEEIYDPTSKYAVKDSVLSFRLNEDFFKTITEAEKAVLAYVATFADSGNCDYSADCSEAVSCKLVKFLDLGCQCSNTHFAFLHKWFDKKAKVFEDGRCYQRPMMASRRLLFSAINLNVKDSILTVLYQGSGMNTNEKWNFSGVEVFQFSNNKLKIVASKDSIFNSKKYND